MSDEQLLERIGIDADVMLGKPVIRGTRLTVDYVIGLMAHGAAEQDILAEYHGLASEDVRACLLFASLALASSSFVPAAAVAA